MNGRYPRLLSASLAIGLALSACGGAAPASPAGSLAAPSQVSAPAKPSAAVSASASAAAKLAASAAASAAASGKPQAPGGTIRVGVLEPLTGPFASNAADFKDAFNLYLASINNSIAGRKVEVTYADTQAQADVAVTKAKQLVENEKVQLLTGFNETPSCYAVAPYAREAQIPMVVADHCAAEDLVTNPKQASPYLLRTSETAVLAGDAAADWAYKNGYTKVALVTSDYGGGLEIGDAFASAFVKRGGSIVQEIHPPLGTNDFGTYLAQLNGTSPVATFVPGADGLRLISQLGTYVNPSRVPIIDIDGQLSAGSTLAQAKDKALDVVGDDVYVETLDTPENRTLVSTWRSKYPRRPLPSSVGNATAAAQIIVAALNKVGGAIENKQGFLQALYDTNVTTAKGPFKFDKDHDPTESVYVWQIAKNSDQIGPKMLQTYPGMSKYWERSADELKSFPFGKLKGKWVGMTKDQLSKLS